ncbi:MAG: class I adenylate-forming enzyme family protein [Woeseiaceae bacterium]
MSWFQPSPLLLPSMLALNARHLANKPAVLFEDVSLDWSAFVDQCARLSAALTRSGLAPGDRVGIVMDNAVETVIAHFGCVYGGFVSVPINVAVSDDAIATMLDDSDAHAVITNGAHTARIEPARDRLNLSAAVSVASYPGWETFKDWLASSCAASAPATVSPTDECNIIYSSGTTGLPKGIVHDHRCRAAWAYDMAVALHYHPDAVTLCSLGLYSNISWVAMLATILAGGTLVITAKFEAASCLALIDRLSITHATMVPVQLQRLLADPGFDRSQIGSLQSLMCCGSPLAPVLKQKVIDNFGHAFIELYGLTEGLVTVLQPSDMQSKLESVGQPCPGQEIVILDQNDKLCETDVAGEIVGRGPLQMAGYHNRSGANLEATWTDASGHRWLRTGDIGRIDSDGFLYLVDRKKDMIISGGQNIYPADIEAILSAHPDVHEVAVIGVQSEKWGETPLAVVVSDDENESSIVSWVNERVGKQQRIAGAQFVSELPRNPNGKVLKRMLRERYSKLIF